MGRRHRSSSVTIGTTTAALSSTNDNNKAAMPNNEDLTACTFLLRQFVHSTNQNQETGRTPFHRAVGAVSVARNGNDDNDDDHVSTTDSDSIRGGDAVGKSSSNVDKERERMDGLFIIDALATRMKEMDALLSLGCSSSPSPLFKKKKKNKMGQSSYNSNISNNSSGNSNNNNSNSSSNSNNHNGSSSSHFHQLMTTRDNESGYTPLHYSILQRDLMTMLLLLQHASTPSLGRDAVIESMLENYDDNVAIGGGGGGFNINRSNNTKNINNMSLSLHPLRLLDGNLLNNDDNNTHDEDSNQYDVINDLTCTTDKEGLTPLQLLGKSSCGGLEHCRRTLTWRALKEGWRMKKKEQFQQTRRGGQREQRQVGISTSVSAASSMEETLSLSGRYRRRMISFGDDRDYDSLQYDIDSGDTNNNDDGTNGDGRARGGSFSINLDDGHFSDDDDESGDTSNDLIPLDDVDFNVLADTNNGHEDADDGRGETVQQRQQQQQQQSQRGGKLFPTNTNDYGCEVLTFGRSDHCALGVPQLSSRIRSDYNGKGGKDDSNNFFTSPSFDKTYKPKRVETFALGDLRRSWSSSSSSTKNYEGDSSKRGRRNRIDSPAVACAASTHHTLVATRSGQLYSFGLGKGGRLGLGDESHRPLPTRILGPLSKRIVASIAAAENHSLCSTSDGAVFAWGSNGFGQLGIHSSRGNAQQNPPADSRLSPRRVEGKLKQSFVVGVACGERHSVALTRLGEVYCWGDNKKGQLGVINVSETQSNGPQRVEGLWSVHPPRRRAIAISAAAHSTLVLTMPPTISAGAERELASLPVNTIYGWGHGNHSPLRVVFPTGNSFAGSSNAYSRMICINPTAIACAKYHNVAITKDGQVYTWGLHSDSLGVPQQASFSKQKSRSNSVGGPSNSSIISSPVLVTGVLGAVAVSASESHTAIVTSEGYLFTWGESSGHKGVRWQPSPRRVKRVHRAVAVAAGKEHTVMLIGATFPPLPNTNRVDGALSLQHSAAIELSRNVDLFNVIPLALVAHRFNCRPLINFCDEFMRHNLDGVLAVGMKNDFDAFLSSRAIVGTNDYEHDGMFHPFLHLVVNTKRWVYSGRALLKQYESTIALPAKKLKRNAVKGERKHSVSQHEEEDKPNGVGQRKMNDFVSTTSREDASKNNENGMVTPTNLKTFPETETEPKADVPPPVPTARGKYYCDLCAISCPDSDSYTFHIHGRKHRNREMHAEAAEEKSVAESMMAMKRMQLVEKGGEDYARIALERDTKQHDKSNIAWGAQHAKFSGGLSPVTPQKGKSFQDILKEEQKNMATSTARSRKGKSAPRLATKSPATLTPVKPTSVPLSSPVIQSKNSPASGAFGASPTLGSFIERKAERKHDGVSSIGASWGATPVSKAKNSNLNWGMKQPSPATKSSPIITQSPQKMRSFSEIQKEEETIRNNEDHMCRIDGNQWFVQQRERAASIGEIQQREQQEQEMLDLIEEQKQIEMAIKKSLQEENAAKKKQKKKKQNQQRHHRKKPPAKSSAKAEKSTPS